MMRILHVIPSLSPSQGGPSVALPAMARAVAALGAQVDVATTDDDGPNKRLEVSCGAAVEEDGFRVFYFPKQTEFYKVSLPLLLWLVRHMREYDVVQVHAVFSFASLAAGWLARLLGVRYVMHPLGVLGSWGMGHQRRWVKTLSFGLLDRPTLEHAAAIYYTSHHEAEDARRLKLRAPAVVIPLGMDMGPYKRMCEVAKDGRSGNEILFMSRIDPKKGIDLLLKAVSRLAEAMPELRVVIAGNGDASYVEELKALAEALGVGARVAWPGFLGLEEKLAAFDSAAVFVLPSYSESFGLALLEAMAAGVACISTDQVALAEEVKARNAVKVVRCEVEELAGALGELLGDAVSRERLAHRGREVAQSDYSLERMGTALMALYEGKTSGEESAR